MFPADPRQRRPDLYDSRELIPTGETGGLVIFDDRPNYWDAWGTIHISRKRALLS